MLRYYMKCCQMTYIWKRGFIQMNMHGCIWWLGAMIGLCPSLDRLFPMNKHVRHSTELKPRLLDQRLSELFQSPNPSNLTRGKQISEHSVVILVNEWSYLKWSPNKIFVYVLLVVRSMVCIQSSTSSWDGYVEVGWYAFVIVMFHNGSSWMAYSRIL